MYGIEKLKEATAIAVLIGYGFKERLADKKITLKEWISFIPTLWKVRDVVVEAGSIWEEIKDLDNTESVELGNYICELLGIEKEKVNEVIRKSLAWLIATKELVMVFMDDEEAEAFLRLPNAA